MTIQTQQSARLAFHTNQRGNVIADDESNIALAFKKLGIEPTFEQRGMVLKIGEARRFSFPENRPIQAWKKRQLDQLYKRELEKIRVRIQRECDFLPKRSFLEAVAEVMAREADFG